MSLNQGGLVSLTLSFAESTPTLTIEGQGEGTGVFFVGTRTSWDLERNCKMDKQDDGSYSLTIEDAHPDYEFKIVVVENNNKHWFSNDEQNIKNGTYTISGSGNTNMSLDEGGALVTFNVKPSDDFSSIVLTISGQGESTAPAKIYLISEATGWTADELYRFKTTDNVNYELYVENMTANVNFKILSQDEHNHMFTVDNTSNANPSELGDGNYNMVAIDAANTTNPEYNMSLGDNGNVTFKFALADDHNSATLNISGLTQNPEDKYARVYLVSEHRTGNVTSEDYMLHTTDGITYSLTVQDMTENPFAFKVQNGENITHLVVKDGTDLYKGEYRLVNDPDGKATMNLRKGGVVVFTVVFGTDINNKPEYTNAGITIGQEDVVEYAIHGQFLDNEWQTLKMKEYNDGLHAVLFKAGNASGQFGLKKLVNGEQTEWWSGGATVDPTGSKETNLSTTGGNCQFEGLVPGDEYVAQYKPETNWFALKKAVETGVEEVEYDENVPAVFFNLQGVRVENPSNGLYIEVRGNKTRKVLVH